ncbi:MAG: hypothetical protein LBK63_14405 [Treponema sp.]|nr:hypothetical protein [Treponema sp.]
MEAARRFVGIDLGKREHTLAIIGKSGKMKLHTGKTSIAGRQGRSSPQTVSDTRPSPRGAVPAKGARRLCRSQGQPAVYHSWG